VEKSADSVGILASPPWHSKEERMAETQDKAKKGQKI